MVQEPNRSCGKGSMMSSSSKNAHTRHTDIVWWGRRRGRTTVGDGYLQPNRILRRLELFFPTPRFWTDRVQQLHYSHGGGAPAPTV